MDDGKREMPLFFYLPFPSSPARSFFLLPSLPSTHGVLCGGEGLSSPYRGQYTLSTRVIKPNLCVSFPLWRSAMLSLAYKILHYLFSACLLSPNLWGCSNRYWKLMGVVLINDLRLLELEIRNASLVWSIKWDLWRFFTMMTLLGQDISPKYSNCFILIWWIR